MPELVKAEIRDVVDFPKPGIVFKDITTAIKQPEAFRRIVDFFTEEYKDKKIDYVAGIESRGFIFGAPLAYNLNAGLIVIRKPGKLPAEVESVDYELEYGTDSIEIHKDAIEEGKRVLVIDDLLATGGTAAAACKLVEKTGGEVASVAFVVELAFLEGKAKLPAGTDVVSMITY